MIRPNSQALSLSSGPLRLARFAPALLALTLFALALLALASCSSNPPRQTSFMSTVDNIDISSSELRMRLYDYANTFAGTVEVSADMILAESDDPVLQKRALEWKINASRTVYQTVFLRDPLGAYLDTWVFAKQMHKFFATGAGRDLFGPWQQEVVATALRLERRAVELTQWITKTGYTIDLEESLERWADEHPLHDLQFVRDTTIPRWAEYVKATGGGALASVGQMEESMQDLLSRVDILSYQLRKQIRWEAQLLMAESLDDERIAGFLAEITTIDTNIDVIRVVLADLEPILARRIAGLVDSLYTFTAFEQEALLGAWGQEREILLANIEVLRQALFDDLAAERAAILTQAETLPGRFLAETTLYSHGLIDYLVLRLAQLILGMLILLALLGFVAWRWWRRRLRRRGEA